MKGWLRVRPRHGTTRADVGTLARVRRDAGQALAEFVLVVPILLLLIFGIVEFGLAFRTHQIITNVAREGARVAVLESATEQRVYETIQNRLESSGLEYDEDRVTLSCREDVDAEPGPWCPGEWGSLTEVELTYPYRFFILGGLVRWACGSGCAGNFGEIELRTVSTMRNE